MRERAKRASASENNFSGLKILVASAINVVPLYYLWYGAINDSIPKRPLTLRKSMNMRVSELGKFSHFHIKKLLFLTYTINVFPFYYLWYGAINDSIPTTKNTNIEKIYEYASERRERTWTFFSHFHIKKGLFLSIFCWSFRYFVGANDMIPNVPTKLIKALLGVGALLATASVRQRTSELTLLYVGV